ncbi:MAG: class I SAM-dependent methyltransferase, partial [Acidiferrobacterales bacterium]
MSEDVPSSHNFFDNAYVTKWADEAIAKRPERTQFFEVLVNELKSIPGRGLRVLELGSGPGFLAEQLLRCCDIARYYLFDFSPPMNELSRARLAAHRNKTIYLHGNFKSQGWNQGLLRGFDVVVSLQAVHEL